MNRDAGRVLLIRLAYVGLEFLATLVLARLYKASAYGSYAFTLAVVGILAIPAAAGFDRLLIKEVAALRARRQWGLLHGLLRRATQIALLVSVAIALIAAALANLHASKLPDGVAQALTIGLMSVPVIVLARVRLAGLQGLGHVAIGQLPEMLIQPLLLLGLAFAAWYAMEAPLGGEVIVAAYLASAVLAGAVGVLLWLRHRPDDIRNAPPEYRTRAWLAASVPFAAILAFAIALTSQDTIIVGWQLGPESAGIYRVASQMAMLVGFPLTAVNMVAAPRIAALHAQGDADGMRILAAASARQIMVLAIPAWIGLIAFGRPVLAMFGPEFPLAYQALLILATAHLAASSAGIAGYMLIMTGHEKATLFAFTTVVAAIALAAVALVPRVGLEGAAVATGAGLVGLAAWLSILCRARLGVATVISRSAAGRGMEP